MIALEGQLTISRRSDDVIEIEIHDRRARCTAASVEVQLAEFAQAITGLAARPCLVTFNDSGKVGTVGQNKEEVIPVPAHGNRSEGWEAEALAPFEVDGWRARCGDITNHHRHSRDKAGQDYQRVVFFRNVPTSAEGAGS